MIVEVWSVMQWMVWYNGNDRVHSVQLRSNWLNLWPELTLVQVADTHCWVSHMMMGNTEDRWEPGTRLLCTSVNTITSDRLRWSEPRVMRLILTIHTDDDCLVENIHISNFSKLKTILECLKPEYYPLQTGNFIFFIFINLVIILNLEANALLLYEWVGITGIP